MIDRYTKAVLTVIALSLAALAIQGTSGSAQAQLGNDVPCGKNPLDPCYVVPGQDAVFTVWIGNWPVTPR